MEITLRSLVTILHGIGFGALFLLAFSGAFLELVRAGTDSAGVVDNGVSGENGSRMFLFNGRRRIKVYGSWTFFMHYMHIAPLLLAFIQQYYPLDYAHFEAAVLVYPPAAEVEMIRYLAGKAGELGR